jgi:hypothetical protein
LSANRLAPKSFKVSGHFRSGDGSERSAATKGGLVLPPAVAEPAAAAPDLFDEPRSFPSQPRNNEKAEPAASLILGPPLGYAIAVTSLGVLFRFPAALLFVLPFVGIGLFLATRSSHARPFAFTLFASGVAAQATSIFITPFTWPLRLGFFVALFGGVGAIIRSQVSDLS